MKKFILFILTGFCITVSYAEKNADLPGDPNEFNMSSCIAQSQADCITASCLTGMPDNCQERCRQNAEQKCIALSKQSM